MTKFRFQLLKNKDYLLYIVCFLGHLLFAPVCYYFNFDIIGGYSIASAFLYGTFILFYKDLPQNFFFTFSYIELLTYCVFFTVVTGADSGTELIAANIIPALFLFTFSSRKKPVYSITMSVLSFLTTIFIVWWDFIRPGAMTNGYLTSVTVNRTFYIISYCTNSFIVIAFLLYLSTTVSIELQRSTNKATHHAKELDFLANHDPLTGLINRRKLNIFFSECEKAKEENGTEYALTIFDIDNFKRVNDTYGHDAGDYILRQITAFVKAALPKDTIFARWGGEEFLILFQTYSDTIENTLNELRRQIGLSSFSWKKIVIPITLTFGLASSAVCDNLAFIILEADKNLMYGKQHGKDCVIVRDKFRAEK